MSALPLPLQTEYLSNILLTHWQHEGNIQFLIHQTIAKYGVYPFHVHLTHQYHQYNIPLPVHQAHQYHQENIQLPIQLTVT